MAYCKGKLRWPQNKAVCLVWKQSASLMFSVIPLCQNVDIEFIYLHKLHKSKLTWNNQKLLLDNHKFLFVLFELPVERLLYFYTKFETPDF